jgi:TolA-binding protein
VVNRFPQGGKVPDSLLKIGFSYFAMGDEEQAKNFLKKAVTSYPFSTAGTKAEEKLKELQR